MSPKVVTPAGLGGIKEMRGLKRLHLWVIYHEREHPPLADFVPESVETLEVGYMRLGPADLEFIGRLPRLRALRLSSTGLTDESVGHLVACSKLEELEIRNSPLTDRSLEALARIRNLRRLSLSGTRVGESSLELRFKNRGVKLKLG